MAEKIGTGQAILTLAIFGAGVWYFWGGGFEKQTATTVVDIQRSIASDIAQQYEIVKRQGSMTDRCMHANMVAGSYLGAKDEANYAKWTQIAKIDCNVVGIDKQVASTAVVEWHAATAAVAAEKQAATAVADIQKSIVTDMTQQYEIVKRQGSATDRCMQANMVAGSYLGAKDEMNYAKWTEIAKYDCSVAGIQSN